MSPQTSNELAEPVYIIVQIPKGQTYHDVLLTNRLLKELSDVKKLRLGSVIIRPEGIRNEGNELYDYSTWQSLHNIFLFIMRNARDSVKRSDPEHTPRHMRRRGA